MNAGPGAYVVVGSEAWAQLNLKEFPAGEVPDLIMSVKGKLLKRVDGTTYLEVS